MSAFDTTARVLPRFIRDPDQSAIPEGIEQRRLNIYRDLFYNNIENFAASGFPILRSLIDDDRWHMMVRDFMRHHECHTPYFLEISQEFLLYLQQTRQAQPDDLPFMLELAHYEWVELALDIAEPDIESIAVDSLEGEGQQQLLQRLPVVSPLVWSLVYQFPVHLIGEDFQPQQPGEQPTYLMVYRNRKDKVEFMEANAVTARLLEVLQLDQITSGQEALQQLAEELKHPQPQQVIASGFDILQQLASVDIILGTR